MTATNAETDVELGDFVKEGPSQHGKIAEDSKQPDTDHDNDQNEDEALLSSIDGRSLESDNELVKDPPPIELSREADGKFMEVFRQLAKEKLEGMMEGLLEAMVEKLRSGQNGHEKEVDVEGRAHPRENTRNSAKDDDTSGLALFSGGGDLVDESEFWPFKDTKTDDEVEKEEEAKRKHFLEPQFDDVPDVWRHNWASPSIDVNPSMTYSLTKEFLTAFYDADPLFTFCGNYERPRTGHAYSILSLVGLQLAHISITQRHELVGFRHNPQLTVVLARIAMDIIKHFGKRTTIGMVLRRCFERRKLFSPYMSSDRPTYVDVYIVFMALEAVSMKNFVQWTEYKRIFDEFCKSQEDSGTPSPFVPISSLNIRILALHMMSKTEGTYRTDLDNINNIGSGRNGIDAQTGATFRGDDLQIHNLVKLGNFTIEWTQDVTHHLRICNGSYGQNVLMIYWFGIGNLDKWGQHELHYYFTRAWPETLDLWELEFTMSILFGYSDPRRRVMRQAYASIEAPRWLWPFFKGVPNGSTNPELHNMSFGDDDPPKLEAYLKRYPPYGIGGMQAHFTYDPANTQNPYYATFPYYGARLRHIREHMDSIQPTGFRGLLRDNRNSMPFYTFWFAVIFGGTSVFLALLSLLVSSIQTWAAYHPPNSHGNDA